VYHKVEPMVDKPPCVVVRPSRKRVFRAAPRRKQKKPTTPLDVLPHPSMKAL
jgi:hypothetical protein